MERGIPPSGRCAMSSEPRLQVRIDAAYGRTPALRDVRLELQPGEVLGLVGASGAGKSTLVLSLLGLLSWHRGHVTGQVMLNGQNLLEMPEHKLRELRGHRIALIPQSPMTALNSAINLESHFREAWKAHRKNGRADFSSRVQTLLSEVQLPTESDFLLRRPSQISVGQAQRVLIALALLHNPDVIVADEPTSALDPVTQSQIVNLLKGLNRRNGVTFLYVSHDLVSVLQLADRIAVLSEGSIVETLPVGEIGSARHPATIALLNSLPVPPQVLLSHRSRSRSEEDERSHLCASM
jgi:peptide/nickel transport system ATP-binding protein